MSQIEEIEFHLEQATKLLATMKDKRTIENKDNVKKALDKRRKTRYAKKP